MDINILTFDDLKKGIYNQLGSITTLDMIRNCTQVLTHAKLKIRRNF